MASNRVPPVGGTTASTSSAGIVQLTDSTSSTSTTTAATPNSVKSAYDLANGAIAKTLTTTTGDIIYASSANTPARLGIGSTDQVLKVSGGVPVWGAAPASATSFTLLNSGGTSLTGGTVTISSLSGYNKLVIVMTDFSLAGPTDIKIRFNSDTGSNYRAAGFQANSASTYSSAIFDGVRGAAYDNWPIGLFYGSTQLGGAYMAIDGCNSSGAKSVFSSIGYQAHTSAGSNVIGGIWDNSAVISSINFIGFTQNWDAGTVRIYGAN